MLGSCERGSRGRKACEDEDEDILCSGIVGGGVVMME